MHSGGEKRKKGKQKYLHVDFTAPGKNIWQIDAGVGGLLLPRVTYGTVTCNRLHVFLIQGKLLLKPLQRLKHVMHRYATGLIFFNPFVKVSNYHPWLTSCYISMLL